MALTWYKPTHWVIFLYLHNEYPSEYKLIVKFNLEMCGLNIDLPVWNDENAIFSSWLNIISVKVVPTGVALILGTNLSHKVRLIVSYFTFLWFGYGTIQLLIFQSLRNVSDMPNLASIIMHISRYRQTTNDATSVTDISLKQQDWVVQWTDTSCNAT